MTKGQLKNIIKECIKEVLNEDRVTGGSEEIRKFNYSSAKELRRTIMSHLPYVKGKAKDAFFLTNGETNIADRLEILTYHGKDGKLYGNPSKVKFVYCSDMEGFYLIDDYLKMIKAIYRGGRYTGRPISDSNLENYLQY